MVVDAHVNVGRSLLAEYPFGPLFRVEDGRQLIAVLDRVGIDRAVAMAPAWQGGWDGNDFIDPSYQQGNSLVAEAIAQFPARLIGFARINPKFGRGAVRELRECFDSYGFRGLNLDNAADGFDPTNFRLLDSIVELCLVYDCPILANTGFPPSQPIRYLPLARKYPNLKLILGHMGGQAGAMATDAIIAAKHAPNIYLETSGTIALLLSKALRVLGPDRVIFGSGLPFNVPEVELRRLQRVGLSGADRDKVVSGNLSRLLPARVAAN